MYHCEGCPFKKHQCMPPQSVEGYKGGLVIVGEAPGFHEVRKGVPFVGPSGKVLDETLESVGLNDYKGFKTNALLCLPPSGAADSKQAVRACAGRLHRELMQTQPDVILALGNTALHAITNNWKLKITKEQGRVFNTEFGIMVPAVHPAMILRSPGAYKAFRRAVGYTVKLAKGHKVKDPGESQYRVVTGKNIDEVLEFLSDLPRDSILAVDIETTGFNPRQDRILCIGIAWMENRTFVFEPSSFPKLRPFFLRRDYKFVWHNGKFDSEFLHENEFGVRVDHDTMLMHYVLNEIRGTHDLEQLAVNELGADPYEHELKPYLKGKDSNYGDIPKEVLYKYLAKDVDYTYQLYNIFKPKIDANKDFRNVYTKILLPASATLQRVERRGLTVDLHRVSSLEYKLTTELNEVSQDINTMTQKVWDPNLYLQQTSAKAYPGEFNPGSSAQLCWILYKRLGLKPGKGFKEDARQATLAELVTRTTGLKRDFLKLILQYKLIKTKLSTFVIGMQKHIEPDRRVHASFLLHGTVTGRLASRNPNLQNIPRDPAVRGLFRSAPGFQLIEADYKGAELRMLAYLSNDDRLIQTFKDGRDLHDEVALWMFGPNFTKDERVLAKTINFGIVYGRTAYDIAIRFGIGEREAARHLETWFRTFPQAAYYLRQVRGAVSAGKVLRTPFGRYRRFGLVTKQHLRSLENEAANFAIQSTASDITLISAIRMQPLLEAMDAYIVNLVHDSIVIEAPLGEVRTLKAIKIITATMADTPVTLLGDKVPFEVEVATGTHWGNLTEYRLKDASLLLD